MAVFLGSNKVDKDINYYNIYTYNYSDVEDFLNKTISTCQDLTLSSVGLGLFYGCTSLTTISFPNCNYIDASAFTFCSSLTSINFPNCSYIGDNAFAYCNNLISANFPNCSYIGYNAFVNCNHLTSINFPNCSYVGEEAFASCNNLISANFPNCTYIDSSAFKFCYSLTTINFPNCNLINSSAFISCYSLSIISLPNCNHISAYAFDYCTHLSTINLPNCSYIGQWAFANCGRLISFYLTSISSVPTLQYYAFYGGPISNYSGIAGQYGSVYVPSSLYSSFLTANYWSEIYRRIVGIGWNQIFNETVVVEDDGALLQAILNNNSELNLIETAKITFNNIEYICHGVHDYDNNGHYFGAVPDFENLDLDEIDYSAYPFCIYNYAADYDSENDIYIYETMLILDPNKFSDNDTVTIKFEEQINYLP